jgi:hypothetical protein
VWCTVIRYPCDDRRSTAVGPTDGQEE